VQVAESQALAPSHEAALSSRVDRIQASSWLAPVDVRELWRQRELIRFFVLRDVKSRYRQTYLGVGWAILRPLLTIVVFSAIFGGLAKISPGANVPYSLWVTPAVIAFAYVSAALSATSTSLVTNRNLITKVYFPRVFVPLSTTLTPIVDFLLGLLMLLALFVYFRRAPSWQILFLPAFLALAMLVVVGVGLWLSSFTGRYRDAAFAVPFMVQIWQYATPVIYPTSLVPPSYRWLLDLNPFTAVIDGFRWSLLGLPFGSLAALAASVAIGFGLTVSGMFVFRRTERYMVDML
jgi:homopolymeric O-antigen transport system permease protein